MSTWVRVTSTTSIPAEAMKSSKRRDRIGSFRPSTRIDASSRLAADIRGGEACTTALRNAPCSGSPAMIAMTADVSMILPVARCRRGGRSSTALLGRHRSVARRCRPQSGQVGHLLVKRCLVYRAVAPGRGSCLGASPGSPTAFRARRPPSTEGSFGQTALTRMPPHLVHGDRPSHRVERTPARGIRDDSPPAQ